MHCPESSKRMNSVSLQLGWRLSVLCLVRGSGSLSALYVQPSVNSTHPLPALVMKTNSTAVFGYSLHVYFWLQTKIYCLDSGNYESHFGEEILDSTSFFSPQRRKAVVVVKLKQGTEGTHNSEFPLNRTLAIPSCRVNCNCYLSRMADLPHHHTHICSALPISVPCQLPASACFGLSLIFNSSALLLCHRKMWPEMPRNKCLPIRTTFNQQLTEVGA